MRQLRTLFAGFDRWLVIPVALLGLMGLVTMYTHGGENDYFERQFLWIGCAAVAMMVTLIPDYRFLRSGHTALALYAFIVVALLLVLIVGSVTLGAQSRFDLGWFSVQPADPAKLVLVIVLAKYFAKRHELIGDFTHILVSGIYTGLVGGLVIIQPDFGSALIIFAIWLALIIVAGIKLRHLLTVCVLGAFSFFLLWQFALYDYQKQRIMTFLDPLSDIQGAGYNAYQSTVAVGSGELLGKGIGYGTQSKLLFLPEYQTDFIFAAYAEEWGFLGVLVLFLLFAVIVGRLIVHAQAGATNFEKLFTIGVAIMIMSHFFVHIGMNVGVLPVTGLTIPFMSYGGSHLVTTAAALGMVMSMRRNAPVRIGDEGNVLGFEKSDR
jgi:rod shape determining protein RodA